MLLNIISLVCAVIGYVLFIATEMVSLPVILIAAGFILSLVDLVAFYNREKLQLGDFIKEAFREKWGSSIAFIGGIAFIILIISVL